MRKVFRETKPMDAKAPDKLKHSKRETHTRLPVRLQPVPANWGQWVAFELNGGSLFSTETIKISVKFRFHNNYTHIWRISSWLIQYSACLQSTHTHTHTERRVHVHRHKVKKFFFLLFHSVCLILFVLPCVMNSTDALKTSSRKYGRTRATEFFFCFLNTQF